MGFVQRATRIRLKMLILAQYITKVKKFTIHLGVHITLVHFSAFMVEFRPSVLAVWSKFWAIRFLLIRPSEFGLMVPYTLC